LYVTEVIRGKVLAWVDTSVLLPKLEFLACETTSRSASGGLPRKCALQELRHLRRDLGVCFILPVVSQNVGRKAITAGKLSQQSPA
jgi:hypothetical protein